MAYPVAEVIGFLHRFKGMTPDLQNAEETKRELNYFKEMIEKRLPINITALSHAIRLGEASHDLVWVKKMVQIVYEANELISLENRENLQPIFHQYLQL